MKLNFSLLKIARKSNQKGQGLTEYAVVLAMVAVAAIAAMGFFGSALKSKVASIAAAISGETAKKDTAQADAVKAIDKGSEAAKRQNSMKIDDTEIKMDAIQ